MPTPTGDCVSLSLHNALSGRKAGGDEVSDLDMLLSNGSKRALTTGIEYELADKQCANSLSAMKAKYFCLSPKPSPKKNGLLLGNSNFLNGNGVKNGTNGTNGTNKTNGTNGTTNGVKNGNGVNGVKVNPDSILPLPKIVLFPPENVCLGWRGKPPVGAGMYNLGNTCYLNSVLQALFHVPAFVNWLLSDGDHRKKCEAENGPTCGDCLTCALAKTLITSRNSEIMRPELITSKLRMICRSLSIGAEEDAHEFMRYLLENVEKGYLKRCPQKKLDPYSRETTPVNQIFGGYLRTEVTCRNCGNVSTTFQHFQDLLLDIRKVCKVDDALDQYFGKESLDGPNAYRCEKCEQFSQATKKFSIERPPKVLCVQLKRFTGSGNKIQKSIEVKLKLSLQKYLNPASSHHASNIPLKYKLIAMVTHSGQSAGGGHYTAIAETAASSFYLFDDASVRQIPLNSVLNTNAYILFFELEQASALNGQRDNQTLVKSMMGKAMLNKATPSTVTSNGNGSFNGSSYSPLPTRKWEGVATPVSQTSAPPAQPQVQRSPPFQPQPRLIIHSRKSKLSLDKSQEKPAVLNRPEAEFKNENRPGFIGPRLPTDVDATSAPPPTDEPAPKRRCLDAPTTAVKVADDKTNGKPPKQLVPYDDDSNSNSSESSLSPAPDASLTANDNQSLTVKSTTPHDWQVTVSPSVRNSPTVSSEGSTKTNWNVTPRPSPNVRKSTAGFSDSEVDSNAGDSKLSRAAEPPGVHTIPPTPAELLSTNGVRDKYLKKKPDGGSDYNRVNNDVRNHWKDRSAEKEHHNRNSSRNEEGGDSHTRWRNGSGSCYGSGGGGPGRSDTFARNQASSNGLPDRGLSDRGPSDRGLSDRGMHNGVGSADVVSQLNRMSHTGINGGLPTWSNERSNLDRSQEEDRRFERRRKDSDYDDEMDRGREKKMREQPRGHFRNNLFDQYETQRPYYRRNYRQHPYRANSQNGKKSYSYCRNNSRPPHRRHY